MMKKESTKGDVKMKIDLSKAVIYALYPRTFTAEGTLKEAEKLIPHLYNLGIDIIYLSVCNTEDTSEDCMSVRQIASGLNNTKNPYRITDYFNIDEEFGTMEDLRDFVKTAHEYGIKVLVDLVYLHCGLNAVFHKEHPEFVIRDENGEIILGDRWPFARFNYNEQSLREYLWSNMEFYIKDINADGFRCDVGDDIPLDFWAEGIRRIKDINPDVIMLNEGSDPAFLKEFDMNYGFPTIFALNDVFLDAEDKRRGVAMNPEKERMTVNGFKDVFLNTYATIPEGKFILINSQNHDTASDLAERRPDMYLGRYGAEAILALLFTMKGVPMIYNGDEVADTAPKSMYWNRFFPGSMSVQWQNLLTEDGEQRLEFVKKLIRLHHYNDTIAYGDFKWYENECDEDVIAFVRTSDKTQVVVMVNTTREEKKFAICENGKIILTNNAKVKKDIAILDAYGVLIIEY